MEHAGRKILHPNGTPLGLGSMEDERIWVLGFGERNERRGRELGLEPALVRGESGWERESEV